MIRNRDSKSNYPYTFLIAAIVHAAILAFIKVDVQDIEFLNHLSDLTKNVKQPIKLNDIKFINQSEVERMKRVGIKDGKKNSDRPDLGPLLPPVTRPQAPTPENQKQAQKGSAASSSSTSNLSLKNLAPELPRPIPNQEIAKTKPNEFSRDLLPSKNDSGAHFYFNPKNQKVIPRSAEQEILKNEAAKTYSPPMNKATERISNFEIRYERPEGVSEDELNSDEKAYYSFYVRSYKNYFSKIYANYEKIVIQRPGLSRVFDSKHLLIGKIDYDENGDIVTVKILKSDDNDDLAYFFEETLKQLTQPNPPKVFTKNRKQFSIYYQIQIN